MVILQNKFQCPAYGGSSKNLKDLKVATKHAYHLVLPHSCLLTIVKLT